MSTSYSDILVYLNKLSRRVSHLQCCLANIDPLGSNQNLQSVLDEGNTAINQNIALYGDNSVFYTESTDTISNTYFGLSGFIPTLSVTNQNGINISTYFDLAPSNINIQYPASSGTLALLSDIPSAGPTNIVTKTINYTLQLSDGDNNTLINFNSASDLEVTIDSAVNFPIGTTILLSRKGTGELNVVAAGSTILLSANSATNLTYQNSGATLLKISSTEWYLFGDIGNPSPSVSSPDLQEVTDNGSLTTNLILIQDNYMAVANTTTLAGAMLSPGDLTTGGYLQLSNIGGAAALISADNISSSTLLKLPTVDNKTLALSVNGNFADSSGNISLANTPAGGSNTQLQYNNSGSFAGTSSMIYDPSNTDAIVRFSTAANDRGALAVMGPSTSTDAIFSVGNIINDNATKWFSVGVNTGAMYGSWVITNGGNLSIATSALGAQNFLTLSSNGGSQNRVWSLILDEDNNFGIRDRAQSLTRLEIDDNGHIGIGLTPDSDHRFSVNGNIMTTTNVIVGPFHTLSNISSLNLIVGSSHNISDLAGGACVALGEVHTIQNAEAASIIGGYGCTIIDSTDCIAGGNNESIINSSGSLCLGMSSQVADSPESVAIGGTAIVTSVPTLGGLGSLAMMGGVSGGQRSMAFMGTTNNTDSVAIGYGSSTLADGAVAIGTNVAATKADTTTVNSFEISGLKFDILETSDSAVGKATLSGGTVTVNNSSITAGSIIFITGQSCTNCGTYRISAKSVGTSFTITSTNASDASTVAYLIIN